jgi:hypothetical protein
MARTRRIRGPLIEMTVARTKQFLREPEAVCGKDEVAVDRLVDRESAAHPFAQDAIVQEGLVGVDEHDEEIQRENLERADGIVGMSREPAEDGLLEDVGARVGVKGFLDIPALREGCEALLARAPGLFD